MGASKHPQISIFLIILLIPEIIFLHQIWNLLPLYTNAHTRDAVKTAMTTVADREGWLLSDMLVTNVTNQEIQLMHREHLRGADPQTCVQITLSDSSLHSCD